MTLARKLASALHPNEAARLRCNMWCPDAESCAGLEAQMLENLNLLEKPQKGFCFSELGKHVSSEVLDMHDMKTPPILKG